MTRLSKHFDREEFALYHICRPGASVMEGYIGITNDTAERWATHKRDCRKGVHHSVRLQRVHDKYGDLEYRVLVVGNKDYIVDLELKLRSVPNVGYNHAIGGNIPPSNKGVPMSAEQKAKISASNRGRSKSAEHMRRAVETRMSRGSYKKGANNPTSKRTAQIDTQTGEVIRVFESSTQVREMGYSQGNIAMVCRGKRRIAHGFFWRYI